VITLCFKSGEIFPQGGLDISVEHLLKFIRGRKRL